MYFSWTATDKRTDILITIWPAVAFATIFMQKWKHTKNTSSNETPSLTLQLWKGDTLTCFQDFLFTKPMIYRGYWPTGFAIEVGRLEFHSCCRFPICCQLWVYVIMSCYWDIVPIIYIFFSSASYDEIVLGETFYSMWKLSNLFTIAKTGIPYL